MINEKENTRISRFLSLVLRHQPGSIGIILDENGWTDVDQLIKKSADAGTAFDLSTLRYIVETNAKQRFAFNETGEKIRASQGHSVEINLGYISQQPPAILYHGTGRQSSDSIILTGLEKRSRQHVHLSKDPETAFAVGQRHGPAIVFEILAGRMHDDNYQFYLSANAVWLTDHVPAKYLRLAATKS